MNQLTTRRIWQMALFVLLLVGTIWVIRDSRKPVPYQKRLHNHEVMSLEEVKVKLYKIKNT